MGFYDVTYQDALRARRELHRKEFREEFVVPFEKRFEENRKIDKAAADLAAVTVWKEMSDGDKAVVRFGMIPKWVVDEYPEIPGKDLTVALMGVAEKDGGMIA
jgi:hypothetical protein